MQEKIILPLNTHKNCLFVNKKEKDDKWLYDGDKLIKLGEKRELLQCELGENVTTRFTHMSKPFLKERSNVPHPIQLVEIHK